ncbi:hypothetical protein GQ56_0101145 [Burkholderia paludis]|uniref:Arc family DNA-binding protein n=1 Tax=Burkholderia paludis TaxID=1506587 RepID=UPI0004DB934B|nr:Arc family DNA-binding protein [Burkholderia paludis]KFG99090.1 hypothetical protein GQ56_0101145 [Burkholderia paludis]
MELEEREAFTVRIPITLDVQIKQRARVNRRTRNAEIIHLLETAIDNATSADRKLISSITKKDPQ